MSERSPDSASGGIALGLLCSVAAVLPALARVSPTVGALRAGVVLSAAASLIVVPLGLWLRRSIAVGLPRTDQALLAGAALSSLPLALCGAVLKSTTHHRPLGGATFAVAALCLLTLCVGLSLRILRPRGPTNGADSHRSAWQNLFAIGCGLSVLSVVALGVARAARPSLVDALALLGAAAVAGRVGLPAALARLKLPLVLLGWVALVGCAYFALKSPQLARSLTIQAPVSFAALSWLGGGS
ncbi:MAG TPA: hypothetical protein VEQ59_07575 [Polyangiaceae bacterium]|nr:hypothetical protein [Polyangiaceae bacterium]